MGDVHTKVFAVLLAFALASLGDAADEITTAGITEAGANALCTLAAGLEGTAAKAGAEARKALVRARKIAQAAWRSQQAASAAAAEVNASARSAAQVLEGMQLGQRAERAMQKAEELAALASETTARCGFLAGQIKQWIETMAAMAAQKDNSGKFCLGGQATGSGQPVLASSNNGQARTYAANNAVAPPTACEKLFDTAEDAKWGDKEIADWPALDNSVTVASSGNLNSAAASATVCPITGVVAACGIGGNYRHGVTWAGLWSITAISAATPSRQKRNSTTG
ncbi:putative Trypanosome variant surface glycoprotein (A type) [Trypanosoma vivax]|nr:putative Trypanosome variant surface glycoprotein (A type) [Trypanosoma vivax]